MKVSFESQTLKIFQRSFLIVFSDLCLCNYICMKYLYDIYVAYTLIIILDPFGKDCWRVRLSVCLFARPRPRATSFRAPSATLRQGASTPGPWHHSVPSRISPFQRSLARLKGNECSKSLITTWRHLATTKYYMVYIFFHTAAVRRCVNSEGRKIIILHHYLTHQYYLETLHVKSVESSN